MDIYFKGYNKAGENCTTTTLDVTLISKAEYDGTFSEGEKLAFTDRRIDYCKLNRPTSGLSRYYGGDAQKKGTYLSNRKFGEDENPVQQLQLNPARNSAEYYVPVTLPAGTRLAIGGIANAEGMQARISRYDIEKIAFGT